MTLHIQLDPEKPNEQKPDYDIVIPEANESTYMGAKETTKRNKELLKEKAIEYQEGDFIPGDESSYHTDKRGVNLIWMTRDQKVTQSRT